MIQLLIGANVLMIVTFLLKYSKIPPQIPLFYSQLWGEGQLADSWMIFILPAVMTLLYFVNQYIFNKFYYENIFIKNIFYYLNLFLIISFSLVFIKIIFLVS